MIYIGADHGGFKLKEELKKYLDSEGIEYKDLGTNSEDPVDYTDYAQQVAKKVLENPDSKGMLICGTGEGMCMAANRFNGIRAGLVYSESTARMTREHNNANIICMGGRETKAEDAKRFFKIWHETRFTGEERHIRRLEKMDVH